MQHKKILGAKNIRHPLERSNVRLMRSSACSKYLMKSRPRGRFTLAAEYKVPVTRELEDALIKNTAVWRVP